VQSRKEIELSFFRWRQRGGPQLLKQKIKNYIVDLIARPGSEPREGVFSATKRFSFSPPSVFS
jgi:hypothetical protein